MIKIIAASLVVFTRAFSPDERRTLVADLEAWHDAFATTKPSSFSDELLLRMHNAKKVIVNLQTINPHATFTHMTPYFMLSPQDSNSILMETGFDSSFGGSDAKSIVDGTTDTIDWSKSNCSLPVVNQGSCNNCWAITATSTVTMANCLSNGALHHFSVQQVTSCFRDSSTSGCWGGNEENAINWINEQGGLCLESDYPVALPSTSDLMKCSSSCQRIQLVTGESFKLFGEHALESQLYVQPVAVSVTAANDVWRYYSGGIISSCPGKASDHSVLAVGFGTERGVDFFKLQNSWGRGWGEQGFIRVQRGVGGAGTCNVAEKIVFPLISNVAAMTLREASKFNSSN